MSAKGFKNFFGNPLSGWLLLGFLVAFTLVEAFCPKGYLQDALILTCGGVYGRLIAVLVIHPKSQSKPPVSN